MQKSLPTVEPTKYKEVFKATNTSVAQVSKYLNLSYAYVSSMLCGTVRLTPENKAKLDELVARLVWEDGDA
jgi:hypothetical protein